MDMPKRDKRRGFTLIELLIVIAIIVVLISAAAPKFSQYLMNARETAAMGAVRTIHTAQTQYSSQFGRFATTLAELGPPASGQEGPASANLIASDLATGIKGGFKFTVEADPHRLPRDRRPRGFQPGRQAHLLLRPDHGAAGKLGAGRRHPQQSRGRRRQRGDEITPAGRDQKLIVRSPNTLTHRSCVSNARKEPQRAAVGPHAVELGSDAHPEALVVVQGYADPRHGVISPAAARLADRALETKIGRGLAEPLGVTHVDASPAAGEQHPALADGQQHAPAEWNHVLEVAYAQVAEFGRQEIAHSRRPEHGIHPDIGLKVPVKAVTVSRRHAGLVLKQPGQITARDPGA